MRAGGEAEARLDARDGHGGLCWFIDRGHGSTPTCRHDRPAKLRSNAIANAIFTHSSGAR